MSTESQTTALPCTGAATGSPGSTLSVQTTECRAARGTGQRSQSYETGRVRAHWERLRIKFWAVKFEECGAARGGGSGVGVSEYVALLPSKLRGKRGQLERQRDNGRERGKLEFPL